MNAFLTIIMTAGVAAAIAGVTFSALVFIGLRFYGRRVLTASHEIMRNSFIAIDFRTFVLMAIASVASFTALGYLSMGVPGTVIGLVAGFVAPPLFQRRIVQKREAEFIYQLPDALRTMAGSLKSGGNIVRALEQVSQRQPKPICQEFQLVLQQYQLGRDLDDAMGDLDKRMKCDELKLLTAAIALSRNVGGNLSDSLEALAQTLQSKAKVEGKIRSMTATGRAQSWVMVGLPVLVGVALNMQEPEAMSHLFNEIYGWLTLLVAAILIVIAFLVIRKIVNIDV